MHKSFFHYATYKDLVILVQKQEDIPPLFNGFSNSSLNSV